MSARRHIEPSGRTILVVDDQVETLTSVRMLLEREGHRVLTADSGAGALTLLASEPVHLMLVDYFMPVMNGEELIRRVRGQDSLVQIVLQTGYAGEKPPRDMLRRLAIQGYHDKSDGPERLLLWVDVALKAYDQLAQLHVAERLKTELLANVSHEFRTPLNVIVGYVDLLREGTFGACPADSVPVLDKVRGNASYLLELVEEFLDLSKLEAGAMPVRRETVQLTPFLRELGDWFALLVRTRPVQFVTDVPEALPPVAAEAAKLRIVIQNLLSNAAKFTEQGEVRLAAGRLDDGRIAIHISDTGPGIAPEHLPRLTERFYRVDVAKSRTQGGTGLGLALVKHILNRHGGRLVIASTLGHGATFTAVIPAQNPPETQIIPQNQ